MRLIRHLILAACVVCATATQALADATLFIGSTTTPTSRAAKGFAVGAGLLVAGFEFEYSGTAEDEDPLDLAPSLRTGMGNVYFQTPVAIARLRPYFTTGGGVYRESLGTVQETHFGLNSGGGVKISVLGPLRVRVDYRVFKLRGEALHSTVHRLYAGANVGF